MGSAFKTLSNSEQATVAEYARAEYDRLVFQQPNSYVSRNAQADSEGWHARLCETIAADPERLKFVLNAAIRNGFTLIEMSIVLVIIGLIVGGVLAGQSLISAAALRAQVTQIEKFNTAANTFFGKYGALPGDIPAGQATQFGFGARGTNPGQGDGNGIIESYNSNVSTNGQGGGEIGLFWVDLSAAHLIEGGFNAATASPLVANATGSQIDKYLPNAKIGQGNYVYIYEGGLIGSFEPAIVGTGINYFGISSISGIGQVNTCGAVGDGCVASTPGLTVQQAYAIDSKMDDGFPQSGNVTAQYLNVYQLQGQIWAVPGNTTGPTAPYTTATPGSSTTCFDNSNVASGTPGVSGAAQHYSVEMDNGAGVNCALSFKMQAGSR